ncbi:MAG: ankyrin repeat domain-containing protein, partial [bacterium]
PIALAAQYGYRDIVNLFIDKGAFVDEKSRVLTRFSVARGLDKLFKILVEKGIDLNVGTNNGGTILHFAAEGGSAEIINILIEKGFNYNEPDRYGWTPLHYAARYGQKAAVELLANKGADLNVRILSGKTAFNMATERGYDDIAQFLISKGSDQSPQQFQILEGPYLGQRQPGDKPEVFALGIISTPGGEHGCVTFSPDGETVYWTSEYKRSGSEGAFKVFSSHVENNRWTAPQYAFFTGDLLINDDVPFVSPDGKKIFFMSKRSIKPGVSQERENYWVIDRTEKGWSEPKPISETVGRMTIRWRISVSNNSTLYFGSTDAGGKGASDIYLSRLINGEYAKPENLGEMINTEFSETAPFIAPDENYIIFGREDQSRMSSLHISFRDKNGQWTEPINMGEEINFNGANNPYVSPDGKYLFFNSGRNGNYDIYWLDAKIIEELKPEELR